MHYSNQAIDINHQDINGNTPLHHFVNHNKHESLLSLLKQGANPNIKNDNGESPLYLATKKDQIEMIADLLTYQADVQDLKKALLDILEAQSEDSIDILSFVKTIENKGWVAHILLELATLKVNLNFEAYDCANLILKAVWSHQHIRVFDALLSTQFSLLTRENDQELTVINYLDFGLKKIQEQADNATTDRFKSWFQRASHSIHTSIAYIEGAKIRHSHITCKDIDIETPKVRL